MKHETHQENLKIHIEIMLVYWCIISYESTFTNREEIDFILDSNEEHSMSLRHIERVEKV